MSLLGATSSSQPATVLLFDGGGVRGISSLIILERLMIAVNVAFSEHLQNVNVKLEDETLQPNQLFDFVAGTSTGGLIAIMMGKLGMSVKECIKAYQDLSSEVFGKKRVRGLLTGGLGRSRYTGKRLTENVQHLLNGRELPNNHPMVENNGESCDAMKCAVVCREHESSSKYSDLKPDPVTICSQPCIRDFLETTVCQAARATSAAFTFFPIKRIGNRYFSDGGVQYNNPCPAIWKHCWLDKKAVESRRSRIRDSLQAQTFSVDHAVHGLGGFENVTIVNIGTGSKLDDTPTRKRAKFAHLIPGTIRMGIFLKETLSKVATESEIAADSFRTLARVSPEKLRFSRLSASNGVCWVKLDRFKELNKIEQLTNEWLDRDEIKDKIRELATSLVSEYWLKHGERLST